MSKLFIQKNDDIYEDKPENCFLLIEFYKIYLYYHPLIYGKIILDYNSSFFQIKISDFFLTEDDKETVINL